jgi:dTDP-4-amino-4,6-dideoxygalactose transaminase
VTAASEAVRAVETALAVMPDPADTSFTDRLERQLAAQFNVGYAVTVSSGTAALHTALTTLGIGHGHEVLIPAATVPMTVAAVAATGARPVFVDSPPGELGIDPTDAADKVGPRTRALLAVHLFGRTTGIDDALALADRLGIPLVEDACQAQGSRHQGHHAGTLGTVGCFSLKDGKILACGEGGYLLTDDHDLARRAAAWRHHGLIPAPGIPAGTRLGHNFRLAQPLAALATHHLADFATAAQRRRAAHDRLVARLAQTPGLAAIPIPPGANGYSPVWRLELPNPREFALHLDRLGVTNSTGTFGLRAAPQQPWCTPFGPASCPSAAATLDSLLAVVITARHTDADLDTIATTIDREARVWH